MPKYCFVCCHCMKPMRPPAIDLHANMSTTPKEFCSADIESKKNDAVRPLNALPRIAPRIVARDHAIAARFDNFRMISSWAKPTHNPIIIPMRVPYTNPLKNRLPKGSVKNIKPLAIRNTTPPIPQPMAFATAHIIHTFLFVARCDCILDTVALAVDKS